MNLKRLFRLRPSPSVHSYDYGRLHVSHDDKWLLGTYYNDRRRYMSSETVGRIVAWDVASLETGKPRWSRSTASAVRFTSFFEPGNLVALGGFDYYLTEPEVLGEVLVSNLQTGELKHHLGRDGSFPHKIIGIKFGSDGGTVYVMTEEYIAVWDLASDQITARLAVTAPPCSIASADVSDDGCYILVTELTMNASGHGGEYRVYRMERTSGAVVAFPVVFELSVSARLSPDGGRAVILEESTGSLFVWNCQEGTIHLRLMIMPGASCFALENDFTYDGKTVEMPVRNYRRRHAEWTMLVCDTSTNADTTIPRWTALSHSQRGDYPPALSNDRKWVASQEASYPTPTVVLRDARTNRALRRLTAV